MGIELAHVDPSIASQRRRRSVRLGGRALGNHLVRTLHGCLRTRTLYDEGTAWAHRRKEAV